MQDKTKVFLVVGFAISTILAIAFIIISLNVISENSKLNKILNYACENSYNTRKCKQGLEMMKSVDNIDKIKDLYNL